MIVPTWLSIQGLSLHVAVGVGVALILHWLQAPVLAILVAAVIVGVVHEHDDAAPGNWFSDFKPANGGPWNGLCDVAAFPLGSMLALLILAIR